MLDPPVTEEFNFFESLFVVRDFWESCTKYIPLGDKRRTVPAVGEFVNEIHVVVRSGARLPIVYEIGEKILNAIWKN